MLPGRHQSSWSWGGGGESRGCVLSGERAGVSWRGAKPSLNFVEGDCEGPSRATSEVECSHGVDGVGAAGNRCGVINSNPSSVSGASSADPVGLVSSVSILRGLIISTDGHQE